MSGAYITKNRTIIYGSYNEGVETIPPVSHPQNCRTECPYGHDRSFCFPCYKKLMEGMNSRKRS